jgi:ABC-2 type transport system permease protein/lipopolysaccharide transport system permease protein
MLCFLIPPTWEMLWFIPAFLLVLANGLWISIVLGTLCARFRDLPQIVASIVQIAFFISPVMWSRTQLAPDQNIYVDYNPFAIFLELLRDPLMGKAPDQQVWLIAIGITIFGFGIAIPFFARFRARIAYYL